MVCSMGEPAAAVEAMDPQTAVMRAASLNQNDNEAIETLANDPAFKAARLVAWRNPRHGAGCRSQGLWL